MVWRAALAAAAAGVALAPIPPARIERFYSSGAYPFVQRIVTTLSNQTPFALLDALMVVVVLLWLVQGGRDLVRGRTLSKRLAPIVWRSAAWSAAMYLAFVSLWGLNYRRVPLVEKLGFRSDAITRTAARAMADAAVDQVNLLYGAAHAGAPGGGDDGDAALVAGFRRAIELVGVSGAAVVPRPKRTLLDWYFRRAGVSGMTDPYFLETLIASDVLPFERPFVLAHEWSHVAGIANEGEANFVGWLACVRASAADRYSGWLFLYQELLSSLDHEDQVAVSARLGPGPRLDLRASRDRVLRNVSPRVAAAGWRVYDSYLKANRIEAGAASYADVVRLVLGVDFRTNWTPVLRQE
jgi:Protein of unknown function (DUF3810)